MYTNSALYTSKEYNLLKKKPSKISYYNIMLYNVLVFGTCEAGYAPLQWPQRYLLPFIKLNYSIGIYSTIIQHIPETKILFK